MPILRDDQYNDAAGSVVRGGGKVELVLSDLNLKID